MSNPSTIWAQLSLPNPPIGAIPFVDSDGATIITDVTYFYYSGPNDTTTDTELRGQLTVINGLRLGYQAAATTGNATLTKISGRGYIAAGANGVVITHALCFATSIVLISLETADATLKSLAVSPSNGLFAVVGDAAATGIVSFSFIIFNTVAP